MELLSDEYLKTLTTSGLWKLVYVSDQYRQLRRLVRKRFKYTCKMCQKSAARNRRLHVHHTFPKAKFPQYTLDYSRAELLCRKCHTAAHVTLRKEHPEYSDLPSANSKTLLQLIKRLTFKFYSRKLIRYSRRRRIRRK